MNRFVWSIAIALLLLLQSCYVLFPKNHYRRAISKEWTPFDAIIVPGFPQTEKDTVWHDVIFIRLAWAKFLYDKGMTKHIIYSGAAVHSPYVEGVFMADYARAMGIPEKAILIDSLAEHSSENVYYSFLLARSMGMKRVALATDPFQAGMMKPVRRRIKRVFKQKVDQLPIVFDTIRTLNNQTPRIDFSHAFRENHVPLVQRKSFFKRLKGTLGMNINWRYHKFDERRKRKLQKQYPENGIGR
jgi:hypothetical protein